MENLTLPAMFKNRNKFDMSATANCAALTPISLLSKLANETLPTVEIAPNGE
jgi:hypothetical protein